MAKIRTWVGHGNSEQPGLPSFHLRQNDSCQRRYQVCIAMVTPFWSDNPHVACWRQHLTMAMVKIRHERQELQELYAANQEEIPEIGKPQSEQSTIASDSCELLWM